MHILAGTHQLPNFLEAKRSEQLIESSLVLAGLTLVIANGFNLSSIATMGSAGFLIIFAAVNFANFKLSQRTHSYKLISLAGMIMCILSLMALTIETLMIAPQKLIYLLALLGIALIFGIISQYSNQ